MCFAISTETFLTKPVLTLVMGSITNLTNAENGKQLKMEVFSPGKNAEYVLMPWEDKTVIFSEAFNTTQTYSRWEMIQKQLTTSKISSVEDLIMVINSYNVLENNFHQEKFSWKCHVLHQYFDQLDEIERRRFFEENGVLSTIRHLSLQLKELVPSLKLLKTGFNSCVTLHQLQIASILSNAFFCTFPKGKTDCPSINFNTLYEGAYGSVSKYYKEKLKCLMHYFKRIHKKQPVGNLSFYRLHIPDHKFPRWDKTTASLCSLKADVEGKIEDQAGFLQMDFANRYVGGGVLGKGCVQEEIRFLISPELISARLFTESLADNESLFVVGAERYCHYTGFSNTFAFAGNYEDTTLFDEKRRRKTYLIILDALYFHHSSDQYRESKILRELKKAYVGFKPQEEFQTLPLATGNWGCGVYGGDPQLKTLLQLMASSQAHRDMLYLTFGNFVLKNQIDDLYLVLKEKAVNVGMLYRIIRLYNREREKNQTVFEFVIAAINKLGEKKLTSKSKPSTSKEISLVLENDYSSATEATKAKLKVEKQQSNEDFPQLDIDVEALDNLVRSNSKNKTSESCCHASSNQQKRKVLQEHSSILDVMWYENEAHLNTASKKHIEEQPVRKENSPSLFSEEEMEVCSEKAEKKFLNVESGNSFLGTNQLVKVKKSKTAVQTKITDCFFKK